MRPSRGTGIRGRSEAVRGRRGRAAIVVRSRRHPPSPGPPADVGEPRDPGAGVGQAQDAGGDDATLRYAEWRAVVAEFAAGRLGRAAQALLPQVIAHACLGAAVAAYEQWLRYDDSDPGETLDGALRALSVGFQEHEPGPGAGEAALRHAPSPGRTKTPA
ncbi:hypothetical protein [Streptomyces sp. MMG1533]|uniref:acyl-CoA-like ligand-binding transcription factor n=1 Tax=Streptomyces sp. MMG1533 TaxID=1415546 RepID=UPI00131DD7FF